MYKLRNCNTCNHQVAAGAKTCPNCGKKKPGRKDRTNLVMNWLIISTTIYILFCLSKG